jgi:hypothetical protein
LAVTTTSSTLELVDTASTEAAARPIGAAPIAAVAASPPATAVVIGAAAVSAAIAPTAHPLSTAAAAHEIMNLVFINLFPKRSPNVAAAQTA